MWLFFLFDVKIFKIWNRGTLLLRLSCFFFFYSYRQANILTTARFVSVHICCLSFLRKYVWCPFQIYQRNKKKIARGSNALIQCCCFFFINIYQLSDFIDVKDGVCYIRILFDIGDVCIVFISSITYKLHNYYIALHSTIVRHQ